MGKRHCPTPLPVGGFGRNTFQITGRTWSPRRGGLAGRRPANGCCPPAAEGPWVLRQTRLAAAGGQSGSGWRSLPEPLYRVRPVTSAIHAARAAHRRDEHTSWEGVALPDPPAGGGMGKPGFPMPLRGGGMGKPGFPMPLRGGGVGKPGFPTLLLQQPMFTLAHAAPPPPSQPPPAGGRSRTPSPSAFLSGADFTGAAQAHRQCPVAALAW